MENNFKNRCEVQMVSLGITQTELGELVGKPQQRINEAFRGDKTPAASALRVTIDQALCRKIEEKRVELLDDLLDELEKDEDKSWSPAAVSLILPEDMQYIVTENGIPVGTYNPVTKSYRTFGEV